MREAVKKLESRAAQDPWSFENLLDNTEPIALDFYGRPAELVARELLGCVLIHKRTAGMIVETEAYLGLEDLAAHASRGRTERNRVLFGPPGYTYVYLIYGLYECLNISAKPDEVPGCILLRALEPLCGLQEMADRRQWNGPLKDLTNGPGKLTRALHITRAQYGVPVDKGDLTVRRWRHKPSFEVGVTPRIGITKCADWPLRFIWSGHPCVSKPNFFKGKDAKC